ncbi:Glycine betaine/proline betaine transport system permease protein ProW [bacterium HR40]|nr:Glycine betaine/proline betaine transport system permease protein ProW [bacterium HR40]
MASLALREAHGGRLFGPAAVGWLAAAGLSLLFSLLPPRTLPAFLYELPRDWRLPLETWLSASMAWLVEEAAIGPLRFRDLTRALAAFVEWPLALVRALLVEGFAGSGSPGAGPFAAPVSWLAVILLAGLLAARSGDRSLVLLVTGSLAYLALFGQWPSAMVTLSSILIAVPFGVAIGMLLGIAAFRSARFERLLVPLLDVMQTVPVFAYLLPMLFLFGFGPVSAILATILYAMPPMVRVTALALRQVPSEIRDFAAMAGCTSRQSLWRVLVPAARPTLVVGVNQVIMLSLNMVIIASMIGAGGLGYDVLTALRRLDIGRGLEAGLAITVLAIALDRLGQKAASRGERTRQQSADGLLDRPTVWLALGLAALATTELGRAFPFLAAYPESLQVSTGPLWNELVAWINVHFFDQLETLKSALVLNLLAPVRRFLLAQPWPWVLVLLVVAGHRLGGRRLALTVFALAAFVVATGYFEKALVSVYLVGLSALVATAIGIPIGIACGLSDRLWRVVEVVVDTLQTLPSFVYLIPVVMLFRVGEFSAMIAVVLYALAPAIRYTAHGIRRTPPPLLEAGCAAGCTRVQILRHIRLPLALPDILLGVNQTIMLALSMLVITALVGTRDLGQEVYIALTKADVGKGLVAGLCVACIAMIADRLVSAAAAHTRRRLGLVP